MDTPIQAGSHAGVRSSAVSRTIPGVILYRACRLFAGPAVAFRLSFGRAQA